MYFDMAPMEGITNYVYRWAFAQCFAGIDRYYTPFISPNQNYSFTGKEWNEVNPEHNRGMQVIPQLLTNNADHFLWACRELKKLGYDEVNLNLGCPSGTVVAKKKGSGFLTQPEALDAFFDQVFSQAEVKVSVKTRLGKVAPEEFERILAIYNRYPISELIVHPRIQKEFYRGHARREWFDYTVENTNLPLSYNGDLFTAGQVKEVEESYPQLTAIMLGRGLIANPALALEARGTGSRDLDKLKEFHDLMYQRFCQVLFGERPVLCRMKEIWVYMIAPFTNREKHLKAIRKTQTLKDYEKIVETLFQQERLQSDVDFSPDQL
jgi:tRNA-dihydrouridine synthase